MKMTESAKIARPLGPKGAPHVWDPADPGPARRPPAGPGGRPAQACREHTSCALIVGRAQQPTIKVCGALLWLPGARWAAGRTVQPVWPVSDENPLAQATGAALSPPGQ